jgi:hypothetical protein
MARHLLATGQTLFRAPVKSPLLAVFAAVTFGLGGWYVRNTDQSTEIIIKKDKVMADTQEAVEEGRELIEGAEKISPEDQPGARRRARRNPCAAAAGPTSDARC